MLKPAPILFLHDFRYWTEYLHPYLDPIRFPLIRSHRADAGYVGPLLDPANLSQRDLLLAGHSEEKFAPHTRVLLRLQHSPGFGSGSHLHAYNWVANSPRRMMIPRNALEMLRTTRALSSSQLQLRDRMLADPKLSITDFDPNLNHFFRAPSAAARASGTILVALNWRVTAQPADLERALQTIRVLAKSYTLRLAAHPFSKAKWIGSRLHDQLTQACRELSIPLVTDLSRSSLMRELDAAEFILTDGSGSIYEGVARGCKALLLDGLSYQRGAGVLSAAMAGGYLPPTRASAIASHPGAASDLDWLRKLHPHSIVDADISARAAEEIEKIFACW